jgi:hypothetical protein
MLLARLLRLQQFLLSALVTWISSQSLAIADPAPPPRSAGPEHNVMLSARGETPGQLDQSHTLEPGMSPGAQEVAVLTGILPLYQRLLSEQQKASLNHTPDDVLEDIRRNQRIIYLHSNIAQCLQTMDCELRRAIGRIDSESSDLTDLKALLSEQRSKMQHRTSLVNLVSGGATRIGAYSTGLTTSNTIPINLLEIFDGVVQIALSSVMVRQEHREQRSSRLTPESITSFLATGKATPHDYPQVVWDYLNHPLPGRKDCKGRRQLVIEGWVGMGRVGESTGLTPPAERGPGPALSPTRSSERSLDITLAMMSDIKAALSSMEASIAELSETLHHSYANDPPI